MKLKKNTPTYDLVYVKGETPTQVEFFNDLKRQIEGEINNHGDLVTEKQLVTEISRLRELRHRNFDRRYEHTLYTRYSNRIGVIKLQLKSMGFIPPKAIRHRSKGLPVKDELKQSLYEVYLEMYKEKKITLDQFKHYTRKDGGVQPPPEFESEYNKLIGKHRA